MKDQALIISLHDVSPKTQKAVDLQLQELRALGIERCSLLVIPDHHRCGLITEFPDFIKWLHQQKMAGHEIVLHGYEHLRPEQPAESFWKRWITQCYTAGEGEFYDLSQEEACLKITAGLQVLQEAGLERAAIAGFIAPAWLLSKEAESALVDEGFLYTTRLHGVIDLQSQPLRFFSSQSMVYSVRSAWRRAVSLIWNELLFRYATHQRWPLLRVGLHPVDWNHPAIQKHILTSIQRALRARVAMTYAEWISLSKE